MATDWTIGIAVPHRRIRRRCNGLPCRRPASSNPGVRSRGWGAFWAHAPGHIYSAYWGFMAPLSVVLEIVVPVRTDGGQTQRSVDFEHRLLNGIGDLDNPDFHSPDPCFGFIVNRFEVILLL